MTYWHCCNKPAPAGTARNALANSSTPSNVPIWPSRKERLQPVACLLHDIGHLVDGGDEGDALRGIDARHEERGARLLRRWGGEVVSEPVRLHVAAKRYLCTTEMGYLATLSPASVRSLNVQGGPFSAAQAEAFIQQPYAPEAVALRRWDERAKDAAACTPALHHFASYVKEQLATYQP